MNKSPTWSFATANVQVSITPPDGVLPIQFAAFVERKTIEIESVLKGLAKRETAK